jgi:protein O-GlcNAc transferase
MELTIDQALQQGVSAHKDGKVEEAERLYRAILGSQPQHPDANHNLGVLAVGVGQVEVALPHFKAALEANLKQEQFWLSYIDALIKLGQMDNAKRVLNQGKGAGVKSDKLDQLEIQLNDMASSGLPIGDNSNSSKQQIDDLISLYTQGKLQEALVQGDALINQFPNNPNIPNILGAVYFGLGKHEEAVVNFNNAIELQPDFADAYNNLGSALHKLGRHEEDIASYNKAIELKPDYTDAHYNLGNAFTALRKHKEAITSYNKAIKLKPDHNEAYNNLGLALNELGECEKAITSLNKAIQIKPDYAEAYNNLGHILNKLGKPEEAVVNFNNAIELQPDFAEAYNNLGNALNKLGRHEEDIASYNKAIELKPDFAEAYNNLGNVLKGLGRHEEALSSYNKAIELKPDYAEAYNNHSTVLKGLGRHEEAIASYNKAIELKPDFAEAYSNLGNALQELGRHEESIASLNKAIELKPDFAEAHNNLGFTLHELGRDKEAIASFNKAIELKPDFSGPHNNKNFALNYTSSWSTAFVFEQHLEFEKQFGGSEVRTSMNKVVNRCPKRRLRIGYVSPDFRTHPVAYFFEPLLENHTSTAVETFCYYNDIKIDDITRRLTKYSDHWRSVVGVNDADVVELIKNDKIDILVDLAGHTANNRLLVFAQKPAPIQVTWLGYPNTTGLQAIDYRFTDIIADPIGEADKLHSEKLIRLGNGFQCYKGNKNVSVNTQLSSQRQGHITFGSFNNLTKVTPEVIKIWSMILKALPNSRLLLKAKQLEYSKDRYLDLFRQEDIAEDRIELHGSLANPNDHLALYNSIDICLDPFPFNGATTTCEALWMGVPVVTLAGDRHAGRVGASILTNVGLTRFIAQDIGSYIETAIKMASDTDYLQSVRQGLRERMQRSPLCDGRSFANEVESAYQKMWAQHIKS